MPAPRATTPFGAASAQTSVTVTRNAATLTGDLVVVAFVIRNSLGIQVTPPDGTWTRVPGTNTTANPPAGTTFPMGSNGTSGNVQVFYKTAGTDGAQSYTFTHPSAISVGWCVVYPPAGTPVVLASGLGTTSQTPAAPAITDSLEDATEILRIIGGTVAAGATAMTGAALTWDAAVTKLSDRQGAGSSGVTWGSLGRETGPTPHGAVAARTITLTNAPTNTATVALGIPAASGGGGTPPDPPANTVLPVISSDGTPVTGETVTADTGTWSNTPTSYAYQWKRNGSNIAGATASSYTLLAADEGQSLTVTVTATNAGGSASATSAAITPSYAPAVSAPVNTVAPAIATDGTPEVGETVTCSTGTWDNSPTSYAYQWRRNGVLIAGATAASYTLTVSDVGTNRLACSVTATNAGGSTTANTASISPVLSGAATRAVIRYRYT